MVAIVLCALSLAYNYPQHDNYSQDSQGASNYRYNQSKGDGLATCRLSRSKF